MTWIIIAIARYALHIASVLHMFFLVAFFVASLWLLLLMLLLLLSLSLLLLLMCE